MTTTSTLETGSHALGILAGAALVVLAGAHLVGGVAPAGVTSWIGKVLTWGYVGLALLLVYIALYAWACLGTEGQRRNRALYTAGVHAATGVSNLALVYTLMGIAMGISAVAQQNLNPQTIQVVVREMADNFALAFFTTVVGLPIATILRALLAVRWAGNQQEERT